ncbi:MAG: helix-turn-helix domain-containing protein, partial [Tidjanibacter sp.]|nr:helix-turn-helix domain-containing protein [Tidjanibacter sp.]
LVAAEATNRNADSTYHRHTPGGGRKRDWSVFLSATVNGKQPIADLLLTTSRSVMDLAIEVGFKDGGNVSRVFKKNKGLSPIEYRASTGMHILPMDE